MELSAYIPAFLGYLDNLHQVDGGVDTHAFHTFRFVFVRIGVVELIAVTVALLDELLLAVCLIDTAALLQLAVVGT